jgi:hypothetical protein
MNHSAQNIHTSGHNVYCNGYTVHHHCPAPVLRPATATEQAWAPHESPSAGLPTRAPFSSFSGHRPPEAELHPPLFRGDL